MLCDFFFCMWRTIIGWIYMFSVRKLLFRKRRSNFLWKPHFCEKMFPGEKRDKTVFTMWDKTCFHIRWIMFFHMRASVAMRQGSCVGSCPRQACFYVTESMVVCSSIMQCHFSWDKLWFLSNEVCFYKTYSVLYGFHYFTVKRGFRMVYSSLICFSFPALVSLVAKCVFDELHPTTKVVCLSFGVLGRMWCLLSSSQWT
jgi:hypothetical protein